MYVYFIWSPSKSPTGNSATVAFLSWGSCLLGRIFAGNGIYSADEDHAGDEDDGIHFYKTRKYSGRETHHVSFSPPPPPNSRPSRQAGN